MDDFHETLASAGKKVSVPFLSHKILLPDKPYNTASLINKCELASTRIQLSVFKKIILSPPHSIELPENVHVLFKYKLELSLISEASLNNIGSLMIFWMH